MCQQFLEQALTEFRGHRAIERIGINARIARVNDLILVTLNVKDFARFEDVQVENWARQRG